MRGNRRFPFIFKGPPEPGDPCARTRECSAKRAICSTDLGVRLEEGTVWSPPPTFYLYGKRLQVDRLLFEDPGRLLPLFLVVVETCPRGDELADDHVLLEPAQAVDLARDRGLREDASGLLERRRR